MIGLIANQALRAGHHRQAIECAESGLHERLTPAFTADLCCTQAEALAQLGEARACRVRLRGAASAAARIAFDEEPPEAGHVQPGVVEGRTANALLRLGELAEAARFVRRSGQLSPNLHLRGQANRLVGVAQLHLAAGEIDQAASSGIGLVALAQGMESRLLLDRIRNLRRALLPHAASGSVRAFTERADQLLSVPL